MRPVDQAQRDRISRNEAAFRRVNEDIGRGRDTADDSTRIGFVCECGREDCSRLIEMTPAEYEHVRSDARRFAIVDGHELPHVEDVVERHDRYSVVEKHPDAADIADETNPRSA
jgi:hypothetical protein